VFELVRNGKVGKDVLPRKKQYQVQNKSRRKSHYIVASPQVTEPAFCSGPSDSVLA